MNRETELKEELAKIEELKKLKNNLRTLESYTIEEKCERFNEFFKEAKRVLDAKGTDKEDEDDPHWSFEMVMKLLGKDVWKVYDEL